MLNTEPIGADLGRVARPGTLSPYDDVRLGLLDAIIAAKARGQLDHAAWEHAFDGATHSLRVRVLAEADLRIRAAAARSRMPARQLRAALPDADAADALLHRLLAAGMPLEQLASRPDDEGLRRAHGVALESAWDTALRVALDEAARWQAVAAAVAAWRRPARPAWIAAIVLVGAAVLVAGWLGGEWPAPEWFRPAIDAWWSLPWP